MKLYILTLGFLGVLATVVNGGEESGTAVAERSDKYYDEMWYRHWTFPVTMAIKAKVVAWLLFITYFSTIMQAIVYQRSEPQLPEVYSVPAHSDWGSIVLHMQISSITVTSMVGNLTYRSVILRLPVKMFATVCFLILTVRLTMALTQEEESNTAVSRIGRSSGWWDEYYNEIGFFGQITSFETFTVVAVIMQMWVFFKTYLLYALAVTRTKTSSRHNGDDDSAEGFRRTSLPDYFTESV